MDLMKPIRALILAASAIAMAGAAWAEDAVGKWKGDLNMPTGAVLPLVITVAKAADGKLSAQLESPAQAPGKQFPADTITSDGTKMTFTLAAMRVSYTGTWDVKKKAWVGTFTQGGDVPLELKRTP
jgi:hypothetical protein